MPHYVPLSAAALLMGLAAAPAPGGRPLATPTRDVDVVYRSVAGGGAPEMQQRVRWDAAGARQRVDPPLAGFYLILDLKSRHVTSVRDSIKTALEIDGDKADLMPGAAAGRYTPVGSASVAGLPCTIWQADDGASPPHLLCVTDDGVMLRLSAGEQVLIEAVSVRFGPADPSAFAVPSDYRHIVPAPDAEQPK